MTPNSKLTRREMLIRTVQGTMAAGLPAGFFIAGCGRKSERKIRPNIVIVVMDTVRRDHLSCYGYERETTPVLKELQRQSRTFDNAYSVSCWTCPSHASLFTGLYPTAHGATQEYLHLDDDLVTLADVLSSHGYQTIGITENAMLREKRGFGQGFAEYFESWRFSDKDSNSQDGEKGSNPIPARFMNTMTGLDPVKPLYLFMNLNGAHNPYESSGKFRDTFVSDPSIDLNHHHLIEYYLGRTTYSDAELRHLGELYDAEILNVDHLIGKIIALLKEIDRWNDTLFIVTSDHGENIGDHEHVDHVFNLYQTTIRIPLIIRYPALFAPNSRDTEPTQLVDIFPTIMAMLGIDEIDSQGVNLLKPGSRGGRPVFCEYYKPQQVMKLFDNEAGSEKLVKFDRSLKAVVYNDMKLILGGDGEHELYDIQNDPGEKTNLIDSEDHAKIRRGLSAMADHVSEEFKTDRQRVTTAPEEEYDPETLEALRTMGYVR